MIGLISQAFGQLVAFGLFGLGTAPGGAFGVGAALVSFVDNHQIPALLPDPFPYLVLFGVIDGGDHLGRALPGIDQLLLIDGGEDHLEGFTEPAQQFVLLLQRERCWTQDQDPFNGLTQLHSLDQQPGHNGLTGAGIIGQQKAQARLWQHP